MQTRLAFPILILLIISFGIACKGQEEKKSKTVMEISEFVSPWADSVDTQMMFSISELPDSLTFSWSLRDTTLVIDINEDPERGALHSDRVELFLSADDELAQYYCFEIDLSGRVLDYKASHYRNTDFDWNWPQSQYSIDHTRSGDEYTVHLTLSKISLRHFGLLTVDGLMLGVFRADYYSDEQQPNWISWIDPNTINPDFHVRSAFSRLTL